MLNGILLNSSSRMLWDHLSDAETKFLSVHFVPSTADDAILNVRRSAAGAIILNFQPSLYALRMKIMPAPLFLRVRDDVVFFVWFRADRARIHFPSSRIQYKTRLCDHYHRRAVGRAILRRRFRPAFFVREDQRYCVRRRRLRRGTRRVGGRGSTRRSPRGVLLRRIHRNLHCRRDNLRGG